MQAINITKQDLKEIITALRHHGLYNFHSKLKIDNQMYFAKMVIWYAYINIPDEHKPALDKYQNGKFQDLIDPEEATRQFLIYPFNQIRLMKTVLGDFTEFLVSVQSSDRIYRALSYLGNYPERVGYPLALSMQTPPFWQPIYDYVLLFCFNKFGMYIFSTNEFQSAIQELGYQYTGTPDAIWLTWRITLMVCELELMIPKDYIPLIPIEPKIWVEKFIKTSKYESIESRWLIKKILRGLYLYGFPNGISDVNVWDKIQLLTHTRTISLNVLKAIVYEIFQKCIKYQPALEKLVNFESTKNIDISWVPEEVIKALADQMFLIERVRLIIIKSKICYPERIQFAEKWKIAPNWWETRLDHQLMRMTAMFGFSTITEFCKIEDIIRRTVSLKNNELNIYRQYEISLLSQIQPECSQLDFLYSIDGRANRIKELIQCVYNPIPVGYCQEHNITTGVILVKKGIVSAKGYPYHYYSIRFFIDDSKEKIRITFFDCYVEERAGEAEFSVRVQLPQQQDDKQNKYIVAKSFSCQIAVERIYFDLESKNIDIPGRMKGLKFFGFEHPLIQQILNEK